MSYSSHDATSFQSTWSEAPVKVGSEFRMAPVLNAVPFQTQRSYSGMPGSERSAVPANYKVPPQLPSMGGPSNLSLQQKLQMAEQRHYNHMNSVGRKRPLQVESTYDTNGILLPERGSVVHHNIGTIDYTPTMTYGPGYTGEGTSSYVSPYGDAAGTAGNPNGYDYGAGYVSPYGQPAVAGGTGAAGAGGSYAGEARGGSNTAGGYGVGSGGGYGGASGQPASYAGSSGSYGGGSYDQPARTNGGGYSAPYNYGGAGSGGGGSASSALDARLANLENQMQSLQGSVSTGGASTGCTACYGPR
eukprot:Rhum_TRINITY_DN14835_c6_g1::Rhum_TRINITY_DN14835_c6_g1_i1::g.123176::m.123176